MVTNDVLLARLEASERAAAEYRIVREKIEGERHEDYKETLERILAQALLTNGRLREAEQSIAVLKWAIGVIGASALAVLAALLTKVL